MRSCLLLLQGGSQGSVPCLGEMAWVWWDQGREGSGQMAVPRRDGAQGEPAAGFALQCARATGQRWPRCPRSHDHHQGWVWRQESGQQPRAALWSLFLLLHHTFCPGSTETSCRWCPGILSPTHHFSTKPIRSPQGERFAIRKNRFEKNSSQEKIWRK